MDNQTTSTEIQKLKDKLGKTALPTALLEKANEQVERISLSLKFGGSFNQIEVLSKYIDWIISLPWNKKTEDSVDLKIAKDMLDKNHYGLTAVKQRLIEYISVISLQKKLPTSEKIHSPILLLVGLAGTGKTTFAQSVAQALGRQFARIPFGGLSSPLDLRGLSKIQPEAEPGLIIKALRRVGSNNPVILIDEIDRIEPQSRGAVQGVLLEVLDPEQNTYFIDHYIDYPFDLSQALFIATANNTTNIGTALMDRLEVVQMPSYSDEEKLIIAKNYILPRLIKETGLTAESLSVNDEVLQTIARKSGFDPGIRSVERYCEQIVRKVAFKLISGQGTNFSINASNAPEFVDL